MIASIAGALLLASNPVDISGSLEVDARVGVPAEGPAGVVRNDNTLHLRGEVEPTDDVDVVVELDLIYMGVPGVTAYQTLSDRSTLDPFRLESDAAYVSATLASDRLYLRAGRQILAWGVAPTLSVANPMNALDLEDPLKFGEPIAHEMLLVELDTGPVRLSAVAAPVFTPALLPPLAVEDVLRLYAPQEYAALVATLPDDLDLDIQVRTPAATLDNAPWAVRASGFIAGVDWALIHYSGRDDLPAPRSVTITSVTPTTVTGDVTLDYPGVRVTAVEATTAPEWLGGLTVWGEAAYVLPRPLTLIVETPLGVQGIRQFTEPFVQVVAGVDYPLGNWIVGGEYVRGFIDEFGSDRVGNHAFAWADGRFARDRAGLRLLAGVSEDGSSVWVPEIRAFPHDALELALGGYVTVGPARSKLGTDLAGPDVVFFRAKVWW